jgi:PPR repeat
MKKISINPGQSLHSHLIKAGSYSIHLHYIAINLISMYSSFSYNSHAQKFFDVMPHKNLASWTILISNCRYCFDDLPLATHLGPIGENGSVVPSTTTKQSVFTEGKSISGYSREGCINEAEELFNCISQPVYVSFNTMIVGF